MKRKGFTLVELLIVIVIIGILAAAMLLSSGAATASAEASNIVSDLRNMKAGALMLYADSMDEFERDTPPELDVSLIKPYMDNPRKYTTNGDPYILTTSGGKLWVGYDLKAAGKSQGVRGKLQGRARTTGLLGERSLDAAYDGEDIVWMVAR